MSYEIAQQRIAAARRTNSPHLNLSSLGLTELPPELFELTNLRVLWLSDNQLYSLPPQIGALSQLAPLRLNQNRLAALPPRFGALANTFWNLAQVRIICALAVIV